MAESGCLVSNKVHALTINHNVKTSILETKDDILLSGGVSITDSEVDGKMDVERVVAGETVPLVGASVVPSAHLAIKEVNGWFGSEGFDSKYVGDAGFRTLISGAPNQYVINQPANSILKNMYIIVRNNNFSVTQFLGKDGILRKTDLNISDMPVVYDEIGLRLNVSIGEESSDQAAHNFFEERDGAELIIVPGNHGCTQPVSRENDGGGVGAGATARNNPTKAIPPNRRPEDSGRRPMFRHNGALLGKDTLIPVMTNYTFSTNQERDHCINQNGYTDNYNHLNMDNIRLTEESTTVQPLFNHSSSSRKIYIVVDAGTSHLTGGDLPTVAKTEKLTGADFQMFTNAITQPRLGTTNDFTIDSTGGDYVPQAPRTGGERASYSSGVDLFRYFASNLLRDNVYIYDELNRDAIKDCIGNDVHNIYTNDSLLPPSTDAVKKIEFKVICDFQQL